MPIEKIAPTFRTTDGREWSNEAAAERHEALIAARYAYQDAAKAYSRQLAESQLTADGELFEFGRWDNYYYITRYIYELPRLLKIHFSSYSAQVIDHDGVSITHKDEAGRDSTYPIHMLYSSEAKAKAALVAAQIKWLQEQLHDVRAFGEKHGIECPATLEPKQFEA